MRLWGRRFRASVPETSARRAPDGGRADRTRLEQAVHGLADWRPELSAAEPLWPRQAAVFAALAIGLTSLLACFGERVAAPLAWLLATPFLVSAAVRLGALRLVSAGGTQATAEPAPPLPDAALPSYTILVPLYREESVAPQIVDALLALDYPADRLQILIIVEASDPATRETILAARRLPPHMRFVVVPEGSPRTKPRALNYALAEATGDLVVVYDAEDMPETDQLRRAAAAFALDPGVGCLQARLNIYNAGRSWLSRGIA